MKKTFIILVTILIAYSLSSQVLRTEVVEHFTNTRCPTCAGANPAFYQVLQDYPDVLHIAYHPSSPYPTCIFSAFNPAENDARTNYYGIYGSTPRVVLQGHVIGFQSPIIKPEQLDEEQGKFSDFEVRVTQQEVKSGKASVNIVVKRVSGNTGASLSIYAGIVEKIVNYTAPNGETYHPDVFREVLYNDDLNDINPGDSIIITREYTFDPVWVKDEMYVFGLLQNNENKEILQADASNTIGEGPSSVSEYRQDELFNVYYPNPAGSRIHMQPSYQGQFRKAEIFDLTGNKIMITENPEEINTAQLPDGLYFLQLTDNHHVRFSTKIIKSGQR